MEAIRSPHARRSRTTRFASIGVAGSWLVAAAMWSHATCGQEMAAPFHDLPAGAAAFAPPSNVPAPTPPQPSPSPLPIARSRHGSYLFFAPGNKTTYKPAEDPARTHPRPHEPRQSYLFFPPAKPADAGRPARGAERLDPRAVPPPRAEPAEPLPDAGALHPTGPRTLIFFTPKNNKATRAPGLAGASGPVSAPRPPAVPIAVADKVPVRVPDGKLAPRKPAPYLLFQPKQVTRQAPAGQPHLEPRTPNTAAVSRPAPRRVAAGQPGRPPRIESPRPAAPVRGPRSAAPAARPQLVAPARVKNAAPPARPKPVTPPKPPQDDKRPEPAPPTYRVVLENRWKPSPIVPLPVPALGRPEAPAPVPIPPAIRIEDLPPLPENLVVVSPPLTRSTTVLRPRWTGNSWPAPIQLTGAEAEFAIKPGDRRTGRPDPSQGATASGKP